MMIISLHGGKCCGIKTINGFPMGEGGAKAKQIAIAATSFKHVQHSGIGHVNFFSEAAPLETSEKRFNRYLEFLKNKVPRHLIEVVLADHPWLTSKSPVERKAIEYACQTPVWRPILEEAGFKEVTSFVNSNSGYTCYVFHLTIGQEGEK